MNEIERRFLVEDLENINLNLYKKKYISQSYLYIDKFTAIRKRMTSENLENKYYYTIKTCKSGKYAVNEIEIEITDEEYRNLCVPEGINVIEKYRYYIPISNEINIELDIFKGIFEGIIFAEVEFKSEEDAKKFEIPEWFGKELTRKISNSKMSRITRKEFEDIIAEI